MGRVPDRKIIDPVVWPIVRDINRLPFVLQTGLSCAGVGPRENPGGSRHEHYKWQREAGYLIVNYRFRTIAARFHDDLSDVFWVDAKYPWERGYWGQITTKGGGWQRVAVYRTRMKSRRAPQMTEAEVRAMWRKVHRVILRYLKKI